MTKLADVILEGIINIRDQGRERIKFLGVFVSDSLRYAFYIIFQIIIQYLNNSPPYSYTMSTYCNLTTDHDQCHTPHTHTHTHTIVSTCSDQLK